MADEEQPIFVDRRRLNRSLRYEHPTDGLYAQSEGYGIQRIGRRRWATGVKRPYHSDPHAFDFTQAQVYPRLRDAQEAVERTEADKPRASYTVTPFHDRRGL